MTEKTKLKICRSMVWVQLALIPVIYHMMWAVDGKPYLWRWNLLSWVMLTGYLIGILAWPFSRGLDKPKLLKWWLRIDFVATILLFIPFYFTFIVSKANFVSERGKYVLYYVGGFMAKPVIRIGVTDGVFIREIHHLDYIAFNIPDKNWILDDKTGYCYLEIDTKYNRSLNLFSIDSVSYLNNSISINKLIDSIFYANPIMEGGMTFVMPDDFSTIQYNDSSSIRFFRAEDDWWRSYADINYKNYEREAIFDSISITFNAPEKRSVILPKDSVPWMSPTKVHRFINNLERRIGQ